MWDCDVRGFVKAVLFSALLYLRFHRIGTLGRELCHRRRLCGHQRSGYGQHKGSDKRMTKLQFAFH